jgi:hypothetical protein
MMEAGADRLGNDPARPLYGAASRRILPEGQVCTGLVIVVGIRGHDPAKMSLLCLPKTSCRAS